MDRKQISELAPNIFLQSHPLSMAGCQLGRAVTVIRLQNGKLLIHSTADFSTEDVESIERLGEPGWLMEATKFHDTHASVGRAAFPSLPYLVPEGFKNADRLKATVIAAQDDWAGEIEVIELCGMPKLREHLVYHRPSKTLIVADLLFNLAPTSSAWTRGFMRVMSGMKQQPATSRLFRLCIKNREAFQDSLAKVIDLDFERIVVAHGDPIETDAKQLFVDALTRDGLLR